MTRRRGEAVACGIALDALFGEPPDGAHPVAWFGQGMVRFERRLYRDGRARGFLHAGAGVGAAIAAGRVLERVLGPHGATALAVAVCAAPRELLRTAERVGSMLERGDLDAARALLPSLVGRDTAGLDEKEIARAVVESVAENLSDALVATALWATAAGGTGALVHRAVNTMDAMVGHRDERYRRFGWAAARLDDAMGWPAARLAALLVAIVRPGTAADVVTVVRRDAPAHPSPNAGVVEAAFAAALGLRLGGPSHYGGRVDERPYLGTGRPPETADIGRAVALARRVAVALALVCAAPALLAHRTVAT